MQNISFFPFLFVHFLRKFWVHYIDELYTDISFIIVSYFCLHVLLYTFCCFMRYFQCFNSPFFAVIIMSICTHSHGSAKQWWHSSWSIAWYMLTSTKVSFVEILCSYDKIHGSVVSQVTSYSYRLYFYVNIMFFHVICFSVYNIFTNPHMTFLSKYDMCMLCDSIVMYQCTYVFINDLLYLILTYILLLSYVAFFLFQQWTVMCYCVEYSYLVSYISFS